MLDPDSTNILQRRIVASLLDVGLIALGTAVVWRTQWIQFEITGRSATTNAMIPTADQAPRINEIAESLHTSFEWGGKLVVIDQTGLVLTALFGIVLTLITFVLLPANTGWSPAKRLFGLSIVDGEGKRPGLVANIVRTVVGLVDALPFVIPGLAGWLLAGKDDFRRRLGDRVAKTYVIDAKVGARFIDPVIYARRNELRRAVADPDLEPDAMVGIDDRLAVSPSAGIPLPGADPDTEHQLALDQLPPPAPAASDAVGGSALPAPVRAELQAAPVEPGLSDPVHSEPSLSEPALSEPALSDPSAAPGRVPPLFSVSELSSLDRGDHEPATKVPRPSHRSADSDQANAVDEAASHSHTDLPSDADAVTEADADADAGDWERPVTEPAPVWVPDRPMPIDRGDGRDFFAPVTAESFGRSATPSPAAASSVPAAASSAAVSTADPDNGTVWNDEWKAWLFWDPTGERWLRHDTDSGQWIPIS